MLSTKKSTSWPSTSRKYSAWVRPGQSDARAGSRRLVHLAEHERHLGAFRRRIAVRVLGDDARVQELVIEVVALTRPLADAGEHGRAAVALGDVVDQLLDEHGLADAGAAEQADLAALRIRREQVDDLDARDQHGALGGLVDELRALGVDRRRLGVADRAALVDRLADHVHDAAERLGADRHADLRAGVDHFLAAGEAVGRVHRNRAYGALAQVLRDLEHQPVAVIVGLERGKDLRQLAIEAHVHDRADHLRDAADIVVVAGRCIAPRSMVWGSSMSFSCFVEWG
jgi:hypothetical protein